MKLIDADRLLKHTKFYNLKNGNRAIGEIDILHALPIQAIVIPENATNGDMIKAMFPLIEVKREISSTSDNIVMRDNSFFGAINRFHKDWWNAPYKAESEEKE